MILNTHLMKMSGVIPTLILLFIVTLSFATPLDSLECTLGVVRCEQTSDGRTMLWKNRDIPNRNQAVHFGGGSNGEYRYVGIGTVGEGSIVHGGANEVGFGVVGSDSYNIGEGNVGPDDDGTIMTLALKTCHTIAQFRHILDSTNTAGGGRTLPTNYVAFDSANTVSIFEAGRNSYFEYSINSSYSFQVRANYSFSGPPPSNDWEWGFYRKKRAFQLFEKMLVSDNFHVDSLPSIARDIAPPGWTSVAFPIPTGYSDTLWTEGGICRYSSVSTFFIQGGKHTETGWLPPVCWFMLGKPYAAMAVPVWPHQTDISQLLTDQVTSRSALCDRSLLLQDSATNNNPTRIHDQQYLRLRNTIETAELQTFDYVLPQITTPISAATAQAISDSMANYAYSTLLGIPLVPLANAPTAAQVTAATTTSLSLSWTDQSNNESRFVLFRSTNGVAFDSVGATANNVTSYLDAGLTPYTKYWYRVYAFNGGGYSSAFASTTDTTVVDYVNAPVVHANPNPLTEPFITNAPGDPNTADHPPVAIAFPANLLGNPTSLSLSYRTSAPPIVPAEFIPPSTTIAKFWNIETTGGDGFDATLDLYFTEDDLPAGLIPPPPTLNAGSYHPVTGAVEHVYNAEVTLIQAGSPNLYRARVLHVTGFSLWALGSGSMLPVELSSLSAYWEMGRVLIQWRTESEHSNREFRLDRKTTGVDYFPIAVLPSRAANGNSSTPLSYQFTDAAASLSDGLMYRLSQIDQDGDARVLREFSAIDQTPQTIKGFALLHSYPNPFNGQFTIRYQLAKADIVRIGLYNIQGALVKEIYTGMTTNRLTSISVNADKLPTGLYVLKLASRGFSTQRKVLLVR